MPGFGAILRAWRGISEGGELDAAARRLLPLADTDPLALAPEGYRDCAALRLRMAEYLAAPEEGRARLADDVVRDFESVREAAMSEMMDRAASEPVGRDEVIRLVHTLDRYARAAQAEIGAVDEEARRRSQEHTEAVARIDGALGSLTDAMAKSDAKLGSLANAVARIDETLGSLTDAMARSEARAAETERRLDGSDEAMATLSHQAQTLTASLGAVRSMLLVLTAFVAVVGVGLVFAFLR